MSLQRIEPYRRTDRCVNCGATAAAHTLNEGHLICVGSSGRAGKVFGTMNLPEGHTCVDCVHFKTPCATIYGRIASDESCDWFPSRFQAKRGVPTPDAPSPAIAEQGDEGLPGGSNGR